MLVPNALPRPLARDLPARSPTRHESVRVVELADGRLGPRRPGRARRGRAATVLCYTNSARTPPRDAHADARLRGRVPATSSLKANRTIRDSFQRRVGSLLYNLECRALFDLPIWDVNGTPKVFPRSFAKLLELDARRRPDRRRVHARLPPRGLSADRGADPRDRAARRPSRRRATARRCGCTPGALADEA